MRRKVKAMMDVAEMCRRFDLDGMACPRPSYGFVVQPTDEPLAVYKQNMPLCKQCSHSVSDASGGMVFTIEEMEDLLADDSEETPMLGLDLGEQTARSAPEETEQEATTLYTTAPAEFDSAYSIAEGRTIGAYQSQSGTVSMYRQIRLPAEQVSAYQKAMALHEPSYMVCSEDEWQSISPRLTPVEANTPTAPAPQASIMDLAAKVNSTKVDIAPVPPAPVEPAPAPETQPVPIVNVPCNEADELRKQAEALLAQAKTLGGVVGKALEDTAGDLAKKAQKFQDAANKEAERKAKELTLEQVRAAILQGGAVALQTFEKALASGLLTVRKPKEAREASSAPKELRIRTARPASGGKVTYSAEIVAEVKQLKSKGCTDREIEQTLHIGVGDGKCAWALRSSRRRAA